MQGRMNIPVKGGGGGEGLELNVFAQSAEPTEKNGIWINTSASGSLPAIDKFEYENINILNYNAYKNGFNPIYGRLTDIPYNFYRGSAVAIGTDIYLFGGHNSNYTSAMEYAYKYSTSTGIYTKLKKLPYIYGFYNGSAVAIGTDIYLFGSSSSSTYAYKYSTITDTYTRLTDIPYNFYNGAAVAIGTYIYLFGGYFSTTSTSYSKYAYKYSTTTDTYTKLTNIPFDFSFGAAVTIGTDIYLFGSSNANHVKYAYKYSTITDTYTRLTNIPYEFYYGSAVAIGTDIYLFGSAGSNSSKCAYKYSTTTDTYTKLTNIPYSFYRGAAVVIGTDAYLLGGSTSNTSESSNSIYAYKAILNFALGNSACLFSLYGIFDVKLTDNISIPIYYAAIAQTMC